MEIIHDEPIKKVECYENCALKHKCFTRRHQQTIITGDYPKEKGVCEFFVLAEDKVLNRKQRRAMKTKGYKDD